MTISKYILRNNEKAPRKVVELASHELPILKKELKDLDARRMELVTEIEYYESVLESTVVSVSDVASLTKGVVAALKENTIENEYSACETYIDKILLITRHPHKFGKSLIEGANDIAEIVFQRENIPAEKQATLKQTLQTTVSRLYEKQQLLKYRYKGTKGKYVAIHPTWLRNGAFREEFQQDTANIEPANGFFDRMIEYFDDEVKIEIKPQPGL